MSHLWLMFVVVVVTTNIHPPNINAQKNGETVPMKNVCKTVPTKIAKGRENAIALDDKEEEEDKDRALECRLVPTVTDPGDVRCSTRPRGQVNLCDHGKKLQFFTCRKTWRDAQAFCGRLGGKLWEPANADEYNDAFNALGNPPWLSWSPSSPAPPTTYRWLQGFHWWIGFFNRNGDSNRAIYSSMSPAWAWKTLAETTTNEDCVDIFGNRNLWGDHPCSFKLKFICERRLCCNCSYNGREYRPGQTVAVLSHCCTTLTCDKEGSIRSSTLRDKFGRPAHDCCNYRGKLVLDGTVGGRREWLCCDGRIYWLRTFITRPETEKLLAKIDRK